MIKHSTGLATIAPAGTPTSFYDCYPLATPKQNSTYNHQMAQDAAVQVQSSIAGPGNAPFDNSCGVHSTSQPSVCINTANVCVCWAYSGTTTKLGSPPISYPGGYVDWNDVPADQTSGLENCYCPSPDYTSPPGGDPAWGN
jgi:hypothetical protein